VKKRELVFQAFIVSIIVISTLIFTLPKQGEAQVRKFNMSYMYFGKPTAYINYIDRTQNSLQVISPSYFDLNRNGTLNVTDKLEVDFINQMHKRNIRVVPFLSNHWDRELGRTALQNREVLVAQIAKAIEDYNLDGINVDIENVTNLDRDNYTDLVKLLRQSIPAEKEVSVAVAANPKGLTTGWPGSYDYKELAKYSDYLMLMTYDESYQGGPPGPVASYSFVENSIKYALTKAPAEKIVLGIPFYGRYWNLASSVGGYGISIADIEALVSRYNGKVDYDTVSRSPKATFTIKETDPKYYVYGRELSPGEYVIWYENEKSIKEKLSLVQKYNIKGTGSWALGQETKETWDYFDLWLNGQYFRDVIGHWAEEDILRIFNIGWMKGVSSTSFQPNGSLTRAQAAVVLVRALELEEGEITTSPFKDVSSKHWAKKEIDIAKSNGIIEGMNDGRFAPDESVTREQMAVLINRILNKGNISSDMANPFTDIEENRWSYEAILIMNELSYFIGYEDGSFKPTGKITRAEMATLMYRLSSYFDIK